VSANVPHLFYGDLNCPFCYALNEQLHELDLESGVSWRGVQHLLTADQWARHTRSDLIEEVERVRERVPGIQIQTPPLRPSTELATLTLARLQLEQPDLVPALRRQLYRALWIDGKDLSSARVIGWVMRELGLGLKRPDAAARQLVTQGQSEWEGGGFERRIPVLVAPGGARSMGLDESRRTAAFLRAGLLSSDSGDTCG
jgi:predicted DsbA family dithiol-disulfide isomerase